MRLELPSRGCTAEDVEAEASNEVLQLPVRRAQVYLGDVVSPGQDAPGPDGRLQPCCPPKDCRNCSSSPPLRADASSVVRSPR